MLDWYFKVGKFVNYYFDYYLCMCNGCNFIYVCFNCIFILDVGNIYSCDWFCLY